MGGKSIINLLAVSGGQASPPGDSFVASGQESAASAAFGYLASIAGIPAINCLDLNPGNIRA